MTRRTVAACMTGMVIALVAAATHTARAAAIGPGDFEAPLTFDFSDLASGTHLAENLPNPYVAAGVQFTGYITPYDGYGLQGNHLATGFANNPAEPFVVRARLLDAPALRVGAYVWPEYGESTTFTAFDDLGLPIESAALAGAQFTGLEAPFGRPIRYVEWRGLFGCTLTTFPRVDGVMIDFAPEPATLGIMGVGGIALLLQRRRRRSVRKGFSEAGRPDRGAGEAGALPSASHPSSRASVAGSAVSLAAVVSVLATAIFAASRAEADVWFLGIGNDGYYTDVTGIYNAYSSLPNPHGTSVHSRLLSNHGGSTILSDIRWLADNARPGDLAIFYYSGHGGTTYDYNYDEVAVWPRNSSDETIGRSYSWVTDDQVTGALRQANSRVPVVAIFDSCYAGGMVGGQQDLGSLDNVFVMMSSREDQVSYGGYPYSRFTQQLVNGLGYGLPADLGRDGAVTFGEWFDYARVRVSGQTPQSFDAGGFGSLPLVPTPEPGTVLLLAAGGWGLLMRCIRRRGRG